MRAKEPTCVASWSGAIDPRKIGVKTRALLGIPRAWTPPFVAVTCSFARRWRRGRDVVSVLDADTGGLLFDRLIDLARAQNVQVVVRSDSGTENQRPGQQRSRVAEPTRSAIFAAISEAMEDLGDEGLPLIQLAAQPAVLGLMSNERRVTLRPGRFLAEGFLDGPAVRWLGADIGGVEANRPLEAASAHDVPKALRRAGGVLSAEGRRVRVEWAWDGTHVWILQADPAPLLKDDAEAQAYLTSRTVGRSVRADRINSNFSGLKLARNELFHKLDWPAPKIEVACASEGSSSLQGLSGLLEGRAAATPMILRTDVRADVSCNELLLPTSPPLRDGNELLKWARRTTRQLKREGLQDDQWAFLLTDLIPARVSAWAQASPRDDDVRVDALWGFPDGLLHLPHDRFLVRSNGRVDAHVQHKPACLLAGGDGWRYATVGEPFDWQRTLSRSELLQIAEWARQLARSVGKPVQLMVLARVGGQRGSKALMPFHYTTLRDEVAHETVLSATGAEVILRDVFDLEKLVRKDCRGVAAIRLDLPVSLLRDPRFLRSVGRVAAKAGIPIHFGGSRLGHAFHLLSYAGALVVFDEGIPDSARKSARLPCVVVRQAGLPRVQNLEAGAWRLLVTRMLLETTFFAWDDLMTGKPQRVQEVVHLASYLRDGDLAIRRETAKLRNGRFGNLIQVTETPHVTIPVLRDAPGVTPLFMDESNPPITTPPTSMRRERNTRLVSVDAVPAVGPNGPVTETELPTGLKVSWYPHGRITIAIKD